MNNNENNDRVRNNIITTFIIHIMFIIGKSLMNYFYLPKGVEDFNNINPKSFPDFWEKDIDIFKYDVKDLVYLSNDFATLALYTLREIANRSNLIKAIKENHVNFFIKPY